MNKIGHGYEVWAVDGIAWPASKCVASFVYFQEALDYREYATKGGVYAVVRCLGTKSASEPKPDCRRALPDSAVRA